MANAFQKMSMRQLQHWKRIYTAKLAKIDAELKSRTGKTAKPASVMAATPVPPPPLHQ